MTFSSTASALWRPASPYPSTGTQWWRRCAGPEVTFRLQLHLGSGEATAWGCDLTEEYVIINSAYTT